MSQLIHDLLFQSARRTPAAPALRYQGVGLNYASLGELVDASARALLELDLGAGERVAVFLEKREETVFAMFGAAAAGCVFVPLNPLLKPAQVAHILADCGARVLVTSHERLLGLSDALTHCGALRSVLVVGARAPLPRLPGVVLQDWNASLLRAQACTPHRRIDTDVAAILYTSGSTGQPKGVVLSHRNLAVGADSVMRYLKNTPQDRLLAVLPLSFDYGLSQLTTAFASGASTVLLNYLLPRDIIDAVEQEQVTGLAAVPPLWIQLSQQRWPAVPTLRYITSSGGVMMRSTVDALRGALPNTGVYLMYGLTEAFRSTYLAPDQLDVRPDSIGKAIPNAEVMVLRPDGSRCAPEEPGELVHRGALVSLGYWNDPQRTAQRFRPLPAAEGLPLPEIAVWSGDTVRSDAEGYLYYVGRSDDMIKTSGYRVSPTEVEQVINATGLVLEVAALGLPHPSLGQAIVVVVTVRDAGALDGAALLAACRADLPGYMQPAWAEVRSEALPRNPNGKIDRRLLAEQLAHLFADLPA